jgi:hypothetical protein
VIADLILIIIFAILFGPIIEKGVLALFRALWWFIKLMWLAPSWMMAKTENQKIRAENAQGWRKLFKAIVE